MACATLIVSPGMWPPVQESSEPVGVRDRLQHRDRRFATRRSTSSVEAPTTATRYERDRNSSRRARSMVPCSADNTLPLRISDTVVLEQRVPMQDSALAYKTGVEGLAIANGFVYRGKRWPQLQGRRCLWRHHQRTAVLRADGGSHCRHGRQPHHAGGVHRDHDDPSHPREERVRANPNLPPVFGRRGGPDLRARPDQPRLGLR